MQTVKFLLLCLFGLSSSGIALARDDASLIKNSNVSPLSKFLEDQPLHKDAPVVRAALLQWEDTSRDVVDVVCPGIFKPIPDKSIKYSGELLAQFIIGSAAYQLDNPSEKGNLMPQQLAGMQSMLKAYRSFLVKDPATHIARLDEFSKADSDGTLSEVLVPLVATHCKSSAD